MWTGKKCKPYPPMTRIGSEWHGPGFRIVPCHTGGWLLIADGKWIANGPFPDMKRACRKLFTHQR